MSPVDSEFLQTETHKAAILAESSTPALAGPEHSPVSGGHSSQSEVLHLMGNTGNSNDSPGGFVSLPKVCCHPYTAEVPLSDMVDSF